MPVTILPLDVSDIPTFVRIELEAFRSHPRMPMLFPRGYTPDLYAFYQSSKTKAFNDPEGRMWKAVDDETGEISGCLQMSFALDAEKYTRAAHDVTREDEGPPEDWPEGGNWAMKRWFTVNASKLYEESFARRGFALVDFLVVDPKYQNQGIGSKLLDVAVREAETIGVPLGLESTPAGLSLYKRFGFDEIKTIKADMRDFGWTQAYDPEAAKRVWMVREYQQQ